MKEKEKKTGAEILIVDNSDEKWKTINYLEEWTEIAKQFDIATGYFEIGSLLALDGKWQQLEKIRILMGDEVAKRTKQAFVNGLNLIQKKLDDSIEGQKEKDDFLAGVPAVVAAIASGKIQTKVYRKKKFHAKAYITHSKFDVVGSSALVGSSNFTYPGLHQNIELNVQLRREVEELQEWFEAHWKLAEDVTPDILKTIERHTREYDPFDVYARSMLAFFRSHELTVSEWEKSDSSMYQRLDQYQKEGYHRVMQIANKFRGALLCDGVGLGKTYIGLMVIERLLFERKKIALLVPKSTREDVWETRINEFLPNVGGLFSNLQIFNHTDILREGRFEKYMDEVAQDVDAIVVDEAHHFRNIGTQRARKFYEMTEGKQLFLLTATPINNSLYDLMHLIEYFSRRQPDYFSAAPLGIHSLRGHTKRMETAIESILGNELAADVEMDVVTAEEVLSRDDLFQALVVQRSRAYVKRSLEQEGGQSVFFPVRKDPQVANYSLEKTYGVLLDKLADAFNKDKPLVSLVIYNPYEHYIGSEPVDEFIVGRQTQVVGLIRTLLLKRFESSIKAFEASCEDLLLKLLYFIELHSEKNPKTVHRWKDQHKKLLDHIKEDLITRGLHAVDEEDLDEDIVPEEYKKKIVKLDEKSFNISAMVTDTLLDMNQLVLFLDELKEIDARHDDKLQALIELLKTDSILQKNKVLIFTEYKATARYIHRYLAEAKIGPLMQVDSQRHNAREAVHLFSPYYNNSSSEEIKEKGKQEIRVLVSTDILAEGLNLQDATCIINYDLHWNPVRLMQRIGRVDRRLDKQIEDKILADHPELKDVRGLVHLWNFLPPDELNKILSLYERVTHKTLRISKTFGIEGRKLLTPEDDYDALREFNDKYEGTTTSTEEMYLKYQQLLQDHPHLVDAIRFMPKRLFSGKEKFQKSSSGVFFCYRLPDKDATTGDWTDDASFTRWYFYNIKTEEISVNTTQIHKMIESVPDTPRITTTPKKDLSEIRRKLDKHIKDSYLKKVQAPAEVEPTLLAWMDIV